MRKLLDKIVKIKLDKGWQWLLYLDIILPGILFLLAYLMPLKEIAHLLARLFHSYNLFVINPIPDMANLMGIVGMLLHVGVLGYALKKKDLADMLLSLVITAMIVWVFYSELNYTLIRYLEF